MLRTPLHRSLKYIVLLGLNLGIVAGLLYGFEFYLRRTDPFLHLPFDSNYYELHKQYYPNLDVPQGRYSWGYLITLNQFGLRERDFAVPKPPGVCRIMVLGDSFTWGKGLAREERYTNLTERYLNEMFPDRTFEVLNFGLTGGSTLLERDVLGETLTVDRPDLIILGFTFNDPQPEAQDYRLEKEQFDKEYGDLRGSISQGLINIGLPLTVKTAQQALENILVSTGVIPAWEVGLDRTYDVESREWQDFVQALREIKAMSDQINLPPPIFAILNQGIFTDQVTDYRTPNETLPIYVHWAHQAQRAADEVGFRTYNHEAELLAQLTPEEMPVNALDQHPSAKVNLIYAQKLFDLLKEDVRGGDLCSLASP